MHKRDLLNRFAEGLPTLALIAMGSFIGIILSQVHGAIVIGIVSLGIFVGIALPYTIYSLIKCCKAKKQLTLEIE